MHAAVECATARATMPRRRASNAAPSKSGVLARMSIPGVDGFNNLLRVHYALCSCTSRTRARARFTRTQSYDYNSTYVNRLFISISSTAQQHNCFCLGNHESTAIVRTIACWQRVNFKHFMPAPSIWRFQVSSHRMRAALTRTRTNTPREQQHHADLCDRSSSSSAAMSARRPRRQQRCAFTSVFALIRTVQLGARERENANNWRITI